MFSRLLRRHQYWFRRAVRVFNGENLQVSNNGQALHYQRHYHFHREHGLHLGQLQHNGINRAPAAGISSLNDPAATYRYFRPGPACAFALTDTQVPSSIVADAFFPLSKTWYDTLSAMWPEGNADRIADAGMNDTDACRSPAEELQCERGSFAGSHVIRDVWSGRPALPTSTTSTVACTTSRVSSKPGLMAPEKSVGIMQALSSCCSTPHRRLAPGASLVTWFTLHHGVLGLRRYLH